MRDTVSREFSGEAYFEGKSRQSPPHTRDLIHQKTARTAAYLSSLSHLRSALDVCCGKGYAAEAFKAKGILFVSGVAITWYAVHYKFVIRKTSHV